MATYNSSTSFDIAIGMLNTQTNGENAANVGQPYINLQPRFQREYEAWDDKMKTKFIESILLGRRMNPIWVIVNPEEDDLHDTKYDILDGMHRTRTALDFFNNQFKLVGRYFSTEEFKEKYDGKKFCDLSKDEKAAIRNYKLTVNWLESTFNTDSSKRMDMYEILNRNIRTLNDFEFNKVIYYKFYSFLREMKGLFKTCIRGKNDTRGAIEIEMMDCLTLSEQLPASWTSINQMRKDWEQKHLGASEDSATEYLENERHNLSEKFKFMAKIYKRMVERGMIPDEPRAYKRVALCLKFFIARTVYYLKNISDFNHISKTLLERFSDEILEGDIQTKLKCKSRNAVFQRELIKLIDNIILSSIGNCKRFFNKHEILKKLEEQGGKCADCGVVPIDFEGDHKVRYSDGGKTDCDNLQVLCKTCHDIKTRNENSLSS
jgi:hypothetical protein|tara:strand:+ start:170 stop:1468 length:1299 start_codon:yes stop_codon:yes gene_type:complete